MSELIMLCDLCKKEIESGAPYISINYHIENYEKDPINRTTYINVISADQVFTMCGKCGNKANSKKVEEVLKLTLKQREPMLN